MKGKLVPVLEHVSEPEDVIVEELLGDTGLDAFGGAAVFDIQLLSLDDVPEA